MSELAGKKKTIKKKPSLPCLADADPSPYRLIFWEQVPSAMRSSLTVGTWL